MVKPAITILTIDQLDEDIERWTRGILKRITHGITHNRCLVILTTLASETALFYHLLGIIPDTTGVRHKDGSDCQLIDNAKIVLLSDNSK